MLLYYLIMKPIAFAMYSGISATQIIPSFSVLEKTPVENETWDAKFSVLKEVLEHHMKEEEEELLPMARKLVPKESLVEVLEPFETVLKKKRDEISKKLA